MYNDGAVQLGTRRISHAGLPDTIALITSFDRPKQLTATEAYQFFVAIRAKSDPNPKNHWFPFNTAEEAENYAKTMLEGMYYNLRNMNPQVGAHVPAYGNPPISEAERIQQEQAERQAEKQRREAEARRLKAQEKAAKRKAKMEVHRARANAYRARRAAEKRTYKEMDKALSFDCPSCFSRSNQRCKSPNGNYLPMPHAARMDMARAMMGI